ncbi:hypothetical protein TruAng_008738 [Truncatella angustata]|nr:hypothetical protein TruAng_008738 [Truncatella angustata]
MEGLTALSLVANICQFVDYGYKIYVEAKRLQKSGTGALDSDIARNARHMQYFAKSLKARNVPLSLSEDEEILDDLAEECMELSDELETLAKTARTHHPSSMFSAIRSAIKQRRKGREKDQLETKLEMCRSKISVFIANKNRKQTHDKLSYIAELAFCHGQELAALQKSIEALHSTMTISYFSGDTISELKSLLALPEEAVLKIKQQKILGALRNANMNSRHDSIEDAHEKTYNWVLDDETQVKAGDGKLKRLSRLRQEQSLARSSFIDWLSHGCGIFYISAKLGAGKSTLMKALFNHAKIREYLSPWARETPLVIAAFFFWKPDENQNTMEALKRVLLYQILSQAPDLIPSIFPAQWEHLRYKPDLDTFLEQGDIKNAFDTVIRYDSLIGKKKILLFIDALDEYNGDHGALVKKLIEWTDNNQSLKICVSGREYIAFEERFADCAKLKLHYLTAPDMEIFVNASLSANRDWLALRSNGSTKAKAEKLAQSLVDGASGVFLWLSLVLKAIQEALLMGDDMDQIVEMVHVCPKDILELFQHFFDSIKPSHRYFVYNLFGIMMLKSTEAFNAHSILQLSYIDEYTRDQEFAIQLPETWTITEETDVRHKMAHRRVGGRCQGMLQVKSRKDHPPTETDFVGFTHRSVYEFLKTPDIQKVMEPFTHSFDPCDILSQTLLATIKSYPSPGPVVYWRKNKTVYLSPKHGYQLERIFDAISQSKPDGCRDWGRFYGFLQNFAESLTRMHLQQSLSTDAVDSNLNYDDYIARNTLYAVLDAALSRGEYRVFEWSIRHGLINARLFEGASTFEETLAEKWEQALAQSYDMEHYQQCLFTANVLLTLGVSPNARRDISADVTESCWERFLCWTISQAGSCERFGKRVGPWVDLFLRFGSSADFEIRVHPTVEKLHRQNGRERYLYEGYPIALFSNGRSVGKQADIGVYQLYLSPESELAAMAEGQNFRLALRDLLRIWMPAHADRFDAIIDGTANEEYLSTSTCSSGKSAHFLLDKCQCKAHDPGINEIHLEET